MKFASVNNNELIEKHCELCYNNTDKRQGEHGNRRRKNYRQ
ncbi:hypothetical protein J2Z29_002054 [Treponema pedis]